MFNKQNKTEMRVVRVLGNSEGIISREQFLSISNRTMLSRYINNGLLTQVKNAEKGTYQITAKFKREYCKEIDPKHSFSGSGSVVHSTGLNTAISMIPAESKLKTGQTIKRDFDRYRKTTEFQTRLAKIQERESVNLEKAKQDFDTYAAQNKPYAQLNLNRAKGNYEMVMDGHRACSTPDIQATMTLEQLGEFRERLIEYGDTHKLTARKEALLKQSIDKIRTMERNYSGPASVYIEICTGSYGNVEIFQKELWAEATGNDLLFLYF